VKERARKEGRKREEQVRREKFLRACAKGSLTCAKITSGRKSKLRKVAVKRAQPKVCDIRRKPVAFYRSGTSPS